MGVAAYAQHVGAPTDVGRKAQRLSKAPAVVFVMTAEDIRRSGATSIPEDLQWAPGRTAHGRSLYTPRFAGAAASAASPGGESLRAAGPIHKGHDLMQDPQLDIMLRSRSRDLTDRQVLETYPEPPIPSIPWRRTFAVKWRRRS